MSQVSDLIDSPAYEALGVSSTKRGLYQGLAAVEKNLSPGPPKGGLYPKAFCSLWPDFLAHDKNYCCLLHADGAGTKASLAYMYWRETGDLSVWRGVAQDALVMNTDDALCVGATTGPFLFSSSLARNRRLIPDEVLQALLEGTESYIQQLRAWGAEALLCGGETADMGDVVRTVLVDATLTLRMPRPEVINNAHIQPGDRIIGLASFGESSYDPQYNSGIGSNGLTLARHLLLKKEYATRYPESYDPQLSPQEAYRGTYGLQDPLPGTPLNLGKALLSPTRSYLPLMQEVLKAYRDQIHGLVHCTGSGQTKLLLHLRPYGKRKAALHIVKDNLLEIPALFKCIQATGPLSWQEMYQVFNMGHRLEIYTDEKTATHIIKEAKKMNIAAQCIGYVKEAPASAPQGMISIRSPQGIIEYRA